MYNILFDNKPIEEEIVIMQYLIDEDFGEDDENGWIEI